MAEDRRRAKSLLKASKIFRDGAAARKLAARLDYEARGEKPPASMASRMYMRARRNAQSSQLYRLGRKDASLAAFTVIHRDLEIEPGKLLDLDPRPILRTFQSALNRKGADRADGWLIAWIHGEYELPTEKFRLHLHGLSTGGMTDVVNRLRTTRPYRSSRAKPRTDAVFQRVKIQRGLKNLPYPLTYACKSYWPLKVLVEGASGTRRSRDHKRIPEPHHSIVLLWLDAWSLNNITLLVHLSVVRGRLVVARTK